MYNLNQLHHLFQNLLCLHIPCRYFYDTETTLYYLQSRYYDPDLGRFINADDYPSTGQGLTGNNMFMYCNNNPVLLEDMLGESATIAGGILGGLWGLIAALTDEEDEDDEETKFEDIISCILIGAATGAAAGFVADMSVATCGVGLVAFGWSALAGGGFGMINSASTQYILDEDVNIGKMVYDGIWGSVMGGTCTAMGTNPTVPLGSLGKAHGFVNAVINTEMYMLTANGFVSGGLAFDLGATAATSFGAWMAGNVYGYYEKIWE